MSNIFNENNSRPTDKPFGGKTVDIGGDFKQSLPDFEFGIKTDILDASISKSNLWKYCKVFCLKTKMRL